MARSWAPQQDRAFVAILFVVWVGFERISVLMSPNGHNSGNNTTSYLIGLL